MPKCIIAKALKDSQRHDTKEYVSDNLKKFQRKYGSQIIVVGERKVRGHGEELDEILKHIDLKKASAKVIAGTPESIARGDFVWIKNEYAGTPESIARGDFVWIKNEYAPTAHDMMTRHSYFAERRALETAPRITGSRKVAEFEARVAGDLAVRTNEEERDNVYVIGSGVTSKYFLENP